MHAKFLLLHIDMDNSLFEEWANIDKSVDFFDRLYLPYKRELEKEIESLKEKIEKEKFHFEKRYALEAQLRRVTEDVRFKTYESVNTSTCIRITSQYYRSTTILCTSISQKGGVWVARNVFFMSKEMYSPYKFYSSYLLDSCIDILYEFPMWSEVNVSDFFCGEDFNISSTSIKESVYSLLTNKINIDDSQILPKLIIEGQLLLLKSVLFIEDYTEGLMEMFDPKTNVTTIKFSTGSEKRTSGIHYNEDRPFRYLDYSQIKWEIKIFNTSEDTGTEIMNLIVTSQHKDDISIKDAHISQSIDRQAYTGHFIIPSKLAEYLLLKGYTTIQLTRYKETYTLEDYDVD